MKKTITWLFCAALAISCHRVAMPALNKEITNTSGQQILVGRCSPQLLLGPNYKDWYTSSYNNYTPDSALVRQLKPLLKGKGIQIFLGTWCGDSRREVPRMLKIFSQAGFDSTRFSLVFVDNSPEHYKQSPQHEEQGKDIRRVPTFIVYDKAKEIGRIVESPILSLEKDLLAILTGAPYTPNYAKK
ncbi:thioredoxin family protein [Sediminibacterium ginsengisoli]|uniref:Thiol-disulfide isomerase or thioredoxin n=1 Tax=Sediminibacterium ginsengisoli TaxID=413434 RepID=A0A1T4MMI3_9BACT|nr:thioredoxin family protein [Sediminibacterium ginsengisoli]SJZ68289.1 hypothetical protein SAMN04488132_103465 [Sediminibacterium ginsengisoli]